MSSQLRTICWVLIILVVGFLFPCTVALAEPLKVGPAPRAAASPLTPTVVAPKPAPVAARVFVQPRYKVAPKSKGQSLYIRVVDAQGNGVSQATVKVTVRNAATTKTQVVTPTDKSGYASYTLPAASASAGAQVLVNVEARWSGETGQRESASAGTSYVVWP